MDDLVRQVVQVAAEAVPVHAVVVRPVVHAAHGAEASLVVAALNQSRQKAAADPNQSKIHFFWFSTEHRIHLIFCSFLAIVICRNQSQRAEAAAAVVIHARAPSHTSVVTHETLVTDHCPRAPKTDITPDQAHRRTTEAPVAHQTETKAWMTKLTIHFYVSKINQIF